MSLTDHQNAIKDLTENRDAQYIGTRSVDIDYIIILINLKLFIFNYLKMCHLIIVIFNNLYLC